MAAKTQRTLQSMSREHLLWLGNANVTLNAVDEDFCTDLYESYCAQRGKVYLYPITSCSLPALFVATIFVNASGKQARGIAALPKVLWYTPTRERELYARLRFGTKKKPISEITRLDGAGHVAGGSRLRKQRLVVTGHAVLPREVAWIPEVIILDARALDYSQLAPLLASALERWPNVLWYAVTADPLSPLLDFARKHAREVRESLEALPHRNSNILRPQNAFEAIALQLDLVASGIRREVEVVADQPSIQWSELRDVLPIAKRNVGALSTARMFIAAAKWLCALPLRPSEFEANRLLSMRPFEDWLQRIRQEANQEGQTATLIAGGTTILRDIYRELERCNPKREALFEAVRDGEVSGRRVMVLVQKHGMQKVLTQALLSSRIDGKVDGDWHSRSGGETSVIAVPQLPAADMCDVLIIPCMLPMKMLWALRTALSAQVRILAYGTESALWEWCLREVGVGAQRRTRDVVTREGAVEDPILESPATDQAPDGALLLDLRSFASDDIDIAAVETESTPGTGPRRTIMLEDGSQIVVRESSMLQLVQEEGEQIKARRAKDVRPGDLLLVTNGKPLHNLFELLRDRVDSQTGLSRAVEIVKVFQRLLRDAFNTSGWTVEQLHELLTARGSAIVHATSVAEWVDGHRFGPSDRNDIERLGEILRVESFTAQYVQLYSAMQRVRVAHRELGRALVRMIRASAAYGEADASSIRLTVDGEEVVLYDISEAIAIQKVVSNTAA
jgi:hypothetical protein